MASPGTSETADQGSRTAPVRMTHPAGGGRDRAAAPILAAPLVAVTCYLTVPLLIPVLTSYPLPLGYMGDILGGGFLLSLASFVVATAALETGSPYAQLGSSRAKTFSAIAEPVVLFVVFTVALLTGTDLPYALAATVRADAGQVIRPAYLLAAAALFMVILHETGRIPVETHTGTNEFGMIEEARAFEHSGPYVALLYPDAHCELDFGSPLELLVATILSAQTTDKRVNMVTPTLFARYPPRRTTPPPTAKSWRRSSSRPASTTPRRTACSGSGRRSATGSAARCRRG